jgi:hypothetical protein
MSMGVLIERSCGQKRRVMAVAALALPLCAAQAWAQFAPGGLSAGAPSLVGGAPFVEVWVDPQVAAASVTGPAIGCADQPFATIQGAIAALQASGLTSPATPGLVHVMPGIYGPLNVGGNGENLPIIMRDDISIQGQAARACVLRGDQTDLGFLPFIPVIPLGTRLPWEILCDFGQCNDPTYVEFVDGLTFQGGHIQVYAETEEVAIQGRVSNCVFDMLHMSDTNLPGPEFGVLMVHVYDWNYPVVKGPVEPYEPHDPMGEDDMKPYETPKGGGGGGGQQDGYYEIAMHLINNTFIQGWQPDFDLANPIVASPTSVAICDVADTIWGDPLFPIPPAIPDPFVVLRGVGNPNIQNNLIRCLDTQPRTALMGIDNSDTTVVLAIPAPVPGGSPTNAFAPTQAVSANAAYNSLIVQPNIGPPVTPPVLGVVPVPAVNPNPALGGADPGFVGEMLSQMMGAPFGFARDWRILYGSPLFNLGFAPAANGLLVAANGTTHNDNAQSFPYPVFDFDGEVYGNLRSQFGRPDIGFDEFDQYIVCGAYVNDTLADPMNAVGTTCPNTPIPSLGVPPVPAGPAPLLVSQFGVPYQSPIGIFPFQGDVMTADVMTPRPYPTLGIPNPAFCQVGIPTLTALSAPSGSLVNPVVVGLPPPPVPVVANVLWIDALQPHVDILAIESFSPGLFQFSPTDGLGVYSPVTDPASVFLIWGLSVPLFVPATTCTTNVSQVLWTVDDGAGGAFGPFLSNMQTSFR